MINIGPKGNYVQEGPARRAITFQTNRPERPLHSKATGPKGHYPQKGPTQRATALKMDRSKGPWATGPKGHYAEKELLNDKYRPKGPIHLKGTGPKGQYVQKIIE
jgi:hypothetical protein